MVKSLNREESQLRRSAMSIEPQTQNPQSPVGAECSDFLIRASLTRLARLLQPLPIHLLKRVGRKVPHHRVRFRQQVLEIPKSKGEIKPKHSDLPTNVKPRHRL